MTRIELRLSPLAAALAAATPLLANPALAQTTPAAAPDVVITATRIERPSFDLPVAIDSIDATQLHEHKAQVNVSETLNRVPGTIAGSRETYAQEQQVTIRGFGARSQFGVRGIKLLADGIPASTPDGQGGTGLFDLASAKRIEVLRGPFSALYGNHSGGVIQVFTEDGPERPTLEGSLYYGSYDSWKTGVKLGGQNGALNYVASLSRYETDGYRDWSEARKDQGNAKFRYSLDERSSLTFVANYLDQPDNLDPLGLTAAQVEQDRRQANPAALAFRTRRSLSNMQAGAIYDRAVSQDDSLRAIVYGGTRSNEQFLAIQANGVSAFDRDFQGTGLRWTHKAGAATLTAGADYERAQDLRQGFANIAGEKGALSRDEVNTVYQAGGYVQGEWDVAQAFSLSGGLRYTRVAFDSQDHFLANGNDSGKAKYSAWTPAVGALWRVAQSVNLYANAGRSFEAPTFIEVAFRPDGNPGLNFDLKESRSNHYEIGMKAFLTRDVRLNLALFQIDTSDEIVVSTNAGGRATFQNAGDTQRRGVELGIDGRLGGGFSASLAATWLEAEFEDSFRTCGGVTPPCRTAPVDNRVTVAAGNKIPGVPDYSVYGELMWRYEPLGFSTALEARWNGKVYANDVNTATADSYTVANLRAGFVQQVGGWRFSEFARVDNMFDEEYIGAVYVNDQNARFYAPAPERGYAAGVSAAYRF